MDKECLIALYAARVAAGLGIFDAQPVPEDPVDVAYRRCPVCLNWFEYDTDLSQSSQRISCSKKCANARWKMRRRTQRNFAIVGRAEEA